MVTDQQVRRLSMLINKKKNLSTAADKSEMCENTARKYLNLQKLPSQIKKLHIWKTRDDPLEDVWDEAKNFLEINSGLQGKTLFQYFQREYPGKYPDGKLRTFQRKIKIWKALEGPPKEVYFDQIHYPGDICESDFTNMNSLNITINHQKFDYLIYHFVLTYSNWETGLICYSENYDSLSEGFQNALWKLGGVPKRHRTDRLTAAIHKECNKKKFTDRYKALLNYYKIEGESTQARSPHENGDVEQRHYRLKTAVDQSLMIRGSRNFLSIEEYKLFLNKLFDELNAGRQERLQEELKVLKQLPVKRLNDCKEFNVTVGPGSTVQVAHNTYSVHSRLIGEKIKIKLKAEYIEIRYGNKKVDEFPRLRGTSKHKIQYRHIIDWLIRKPGAFANYRYRDDLFPTTHFRMAYDYLKEKEPSNASKEYLKILHLAAKESETGVDNALRLLFDKGEIISLDSVKKILESNEQAPLLTDVKISDVNLNSYDELYENQEVFYG